jgi:hypothetical protein
MYNYSIITTYLDIRDEKQDTQYRKELLDVFNIEQYDHQTIMQCMKIIFEKYKLHNQVINILQTLIENETKFPIELDQETAFMMMFSFENFYFFHKALVELERDENINNQLYNKIIKNLQKK